MTSKIKSKRVSLTQDDLELISRLSYNEKHKVIGWKDWATYKEAREQGFIIKYPRLCEICGNRLKDKTRYFNHIVSIHGIVGCVLA